MTPRRLWWMFGEKTRNFGDVLTPDLFDYYKIPYVFEKDSYDTICIGSIGNKARSGTLVLGAGVAWRSTKINPRSKWLFARGPLTRAAVLSSGGACPETYGDPALLLPRFCEESPKKHRLGIVPHYQEFRLVKRDHPEEHVINLNNPDPLETARQITQCKSVISSSLHGIICAHAYGIPAAWVKFSDRIIGDDTKYHDHHAAVGLEAKLSTMQAPIFQCPESFSAQPIHELMLSFRGACEEMVSAGGKLCP
jgi:pyruvyltransferase